MKKPRSRREARAVWDTMPHRVAFLMLSFAAQHELDTLALLERPKDKRYKRLRYELWGLLREERDENGDRLYTFPQIAEWFNVSHSHVQTGVKVARDTASLTNKGVAEEPG